VENVDELLSDAREFDEAHPEDGGLEAFLEQASLVADIDQFQTTSDCVTMMTLHAAKGLEFPVVFIIAVEDDVLPHMHSKEQPQQLEEERRLLFVGMTRAEEELYLSAAQQRMVRGETKYRVTSPFLMELPREEMEVFGSLGYGGSVDESFSDPDAFVEPEYAEAWDESELGCSAELEFDEQLQRAASRKRGRRRAGEAISSTAASAGVPLLRAAEMLDNDSPDAGCPPETFREGMVVIHPQHGIGKILTVAGSGKKLAARVQFTGEEHARSFQLAFSPLKPLKT
jgi:DNA helicase-2/ATP-dependent DNA helicase PcrA